MKKKNNWDMRWLWHLFMLYKSLSYFVEKLYIVDIVTILKIPPKTPIASENDIRQLQFICSIEHLMSVTKSSFDGWCFRTQLIEKLFINK